MKTYNKRSNAVQLRMNDTRIRIHARIRFAGDTQLVIQEKSAIALVQSALERQFSRENPYFCDMRGNEYDFPEKKGQRIKLSFQAEYLAAGDCKAPHVCFHLLDMAGVSCMLFFPTWRAQKSKHILLFTGDIRNGGHTYTQKEYGDISTHEFGHALGIADLYGGLAPYALCRRPPAPITPEMPSNDIMRTCFGDVWATPNDLEMALLAQAENAPQSHFSHRLYKGLRKKSEAIRG